MQVKLQKTYNYLIQLTIIIIVYVFLYFELFQKRDLHELIQLFEKQWLTGTYSVLLIGLVILIFINQVIEAVKWKYLISKIIRVKFNTALFAVFAGISLGVFTPNRIGDFLGRAFILEKPFQAKGVLLTMVGSISQLITTMVLGIIGLMLFFPLNYELSVSAIAGIIFLGIFLILLFILLYINISGLTKIIQKFTGRFSHKLESYLEVIKEFTIMELIRILLYSLFRYLVFNFQYFLLLRFFGVEIDLLSSFMITSVVYIAMASIPTIALSELGVRGSVSVFLFSLYFEKNGVVFGDLSLAVFAASSSLWLINIIFPALIGTLFVYKLRFFKR